MGMRNEFNFRCKNPVTIRSCKYLNKPPYCKGVSPWPSLWRRTHHRVKFRVSATLGFKCFNNARIVIAGIELMQKLKKGQYGVRFSFGLCSHDISSNVLAA